MACPALHHFSTSQTRHDLKENIIEHKMCVLIFSTTFVWNILHFKKNWERYDQKIMSLFTYSTCRSSRTVPVARHVQYLSLFTYSSCRSSRTVPVALHVQYLLLFMYSTCRSSRTVPVALHAQYLLLFTYSTCCSLRGLLEKYPTVFFYANTWWIII